MFESKEKKLEYDGDENTAQKKTSYSMMGLTDTFSSVQFSSSVMSDSL